MVYLIITWEHLRPMQSLGFHPRPIGVRLCMVQSQVTYVYIEI